VVETLAGRVEMPATTRDPESIDVGSMVIVASVRAGVADVSALHREQSKAVNREKSTRAPGMGQTATQRES
jgi:hypothetical protein